MSRSCSRAVFGRYARTTSPSGNSARTTNRLSRARNRGWAAVGPEGTVVVLGAGNGDGAALCRGRRREARVDGKAHRGVADPTVVSDDHPRSGGSPAGEGRRWQVSQDDRVAGTLLATAVGDALGAGYEFSSSPIGEVDMIGGGLGPFAPGEWTDDTSMAIGIAEVAAGGSLDPDAIGERFLAWYRSSPPDMGNATRAVLGSVGTAGQLAGAAAAMYARQPRGAAGNGALMRTAPVALAHLGDDDAIAAGARAVAELTHADPLAGDSCVLWSIAIDRAIRQSRLDGVWDALALLPPERRERWDRALDEAGSGPASRFAPNGFTVTALQAAHAAIQLTPVPDARPEAHLVDALVAAVRIGDDTDTVAAIAGGLLGARWGASAVPARWRGMLHGWPGYDGEDLVRLAYEIVGDRPG
ncbi:MAG: ADP-ribosylglycohydrolase family protein [Nitriliruptor sp.]|nr:MAG: ADP-ribosylglycohydrolase family protein [Nitriliruptor sp.]